MSSNKGLHQYFIHFIYLFVSYLCYFIYDSSSSMKQNISEISKIMNLLTTIMRQQVTIASNDMIAILRMVKSFCSWPLRLGFNHLSLYFVAPLVIYYLALSNPTPTPTWDLWNPPSTKHRLRNDLPVLWGRSRCMYSELNSVDNADHIDLHFTANISMKYNYLCDHSQPWPQPPTIPPRIKHGSISIWKCVSEYGS